MKNKLPKSVFIASAVCLLPMVAGALLFDHLPEQIPTHFNFAGEVDGYSHKALFVFGFPIFMALMNLLMGFSLTFDPKRQNNSQALYKISLFILPVTTLCIMALALSSALGGNLPIGRLLHLFLGALLLVVGNYLPKTRQNYLIGIKLPWTLHSEENWRKTHRIGGFLWTLGGLILLCAALFNWQSPYLFAALMLIIVLIPTVYSFWLFQKGI